MHQVKGGVWFWGVGQLSLEVAMRLREKGTFDSGSMSEEEYANWFEMNFLDSSVFLHGGESTISGSIIFSILLFISILIAGRLLIRKYKL